jgi:hypothetical protein
MYDPEVPAPVGTPPPIFLYIFLNYLVETIAGFLMWGALSDERTGL